VPWQKGTTIEKSVENHKRQQTTADAISSAAQITAMSSPKTAALLLAGHPPAGCFLNHNNAWMGAVVLSAFVVVNQHLRAWWLTMADFIC
jgi:hypothetical protein